jgi:serine/threonine-protein kinase
MRITLRVTAGILKGQTFTFTSHDTFMVGRSKRAHLQLPSKDRSCSRIHCMLEINPPRCRLMDMESNNGTWVNDKRVSVAELHDGDKIRVGASILRVVIEQSPAPPAIAAPPTAVSARLTMPQPVDEYARHSPVSAVSPDNPSEPESLPPPAIPGYRLLRQLGEGGMGVVHLAERLGNGDQVAVKTIRPGLHASPKDVDRFLREARILRDLDHPHIVRFRDMGESDGCLYFAMDYVPGPDAGQLVKRHGPLAVGRAVRLACQLLEALEYAHARRFVHRDIKPANLLIATEDGREAAKLTDFGLARVYQASQLSGLTLAGEVGGTPAFMAPEQLVNFRDSPASVDQYSAAATLYHLLTGHFVYDVPQEVRQLYAMILNEEPVPIRRRRAEIPAALAKVIHRALARDPGDRYRTVEGLRLSLLALQVSS